MYVRLSDLLIWYSSFELFVYLNQDEFGTLSSIEYLMNQCLLVPTKCKLETNGAGYLASI